MTSTPSSIGSEELLDPLLDELHNVESVIHVTRENIDALNAKFASLQEPPALYVAEYQELTSKLHELEAKQAELLEHLNGQDEKFEGLNQLSDSYVYQSYYANHQQIEQHQQQQTQQQQQEQYLQYLYHKGLHSSDKGGGGVEMVNFFY